jgi:hypothetical protein
LDLFEGLQLLATCQIVGTPNGGTDVRREVNGIHVIGWALAHVGADFFSLPFGLSLESPAHGRSRTASLQLGLHLLAATLFAHEPAAFREHGSAGLYDHGGPLGASMSTISPG